MGVVVGSNSRLKEAGRRKPNLTGQPSSGPPPGGANSTIALTIAMSTAKLIIPLTKEPSILI